MMRYSASRRMFGLLVKKRGYETAYQLFPGNIPTEPGLMR